MALKRAAPICHVGLPNTKDWHVEAARQFSYVLYARSTRLIVETEPLQPWLKDATVIGTVMLVLKPALLEPYRTSLRPSLTDLESLASVVN